jgi:putative ABC transport system permease protein
MTSTMVGAVLRGIRSRALLSAGSILLIVLAIGSAVLGPVFQVAVTKSYVVTRLNDAPPAATGVSRELVPEPDFQGGPEAGVALAIEESIERVEGPFGPTTTQLETARVQGSVNNPDGTPGQVRLLARQDACDHLDITGECPTAPGQAMLLAGDADYSGLEIGDQVTLKGLPNVSIVGIYRVPTTERDFWYDVSRFDSVPRRIVEVARGTGPSITPYQPGPLVVDLSSFDAVPVELWRVRADRRLEIPADWTEEDLAAAARSTKAAAGDPVEIERATLVGNPLGDLPALLAEVRSQEDTARASIAPAVLSLVLVALALLLRLLTAASDLRLPELALASLRGVDERRLWGLGLVEPLALLAISVPLGIAAGIGLSMGLIRWWLVPGLPLPLPLEAWVASGTVVLATLVVAVVAVGLVLRDTLASQLAGLKRPAARRRTALVAELALVAVAIGMLVAQLSAGKVEKPDVTDMVLPVVLAVVAGLIATRLIAAIARRASRRRTGRSLPGFVTARALGRRREGTLVILPITAAIAIGVFAVGVYDSASDWRASVAATSAPAAEVWSTSLSLSQAVDLTEELDPEGEHLMALAEFLSPGTRLSVVDGPRMASVLGWPQDWTPGTSEQQVQELIQSRGITPRLVGREIALTADQQLTTDADVTVELRLITSTGASKDVYLGPFPAGESTQSERTPFCRNGCTLGRMTLGGPAALKIDMTGTFTVQDVLVDGEVLPGALSESGWAPSAGVGSDLAEGQTADVSVVGDALEIAVDTVGSTAFVRLAPGELQPERPVVVGRQADYMLGDDPDEQSLPISGVGMPVRKVLSAESLPLLGPSGILIDYRMLFTDRLIYSNTVEVFVAVDGDTPAAMKTALADRGLSLNRTLVEEKSILDQGAYALALRLYAVAAVLVLLMALAGLFVSTAVQLPARRRDAAALRVVGVRRRVVVSAVAREFIAVLGGAAVAGIAAGALAQYVVLKTIQLGYVEALVTPRLVAAVDVAQLGVIAACAAGAFGAFAFVSATLTVRGARGATLRETAR